ncbi:hypothetical protein AAMO2058_001423000 [Amorphochlora amoebiformis]
MYGNSDTHSRENKIMSIFQHFDYDGDGYLNAEEFTAFVNSILIDGGHLVSEKEYEELAKGLGADPSKGVEIKHIRCALQKRNVDDDCKKLRNCTRKRVSTPKVVAVSLSQDKLNGVLREGAVRKRGELNRRYKERYMKLEKVHGRSFLVYYKNKGEEKHSGQILLEEASIELDENNNKNWRVVTSKRKFYLKSSNEEERREWCLALAEHCSDSLNKNSVKTLKGMGTFYDSFSHFSLNSGKSQEKT